MAGARLFLRGAELMQLSEVIAESASDGLALLDAKQVGQLRRIRNLAAQLPDDWSGMMGRSSLQEDFGAYRFQLAYMSYALALTHVHRLPAAPALFRTTFEKLIAKILSPDVWSYWHFVSTGNGPYNKALGELPAQWNPVDTDNIMYSAYVQSMALLYHLLFDDARFAQPGALSFRLRPLFWGGGDKVFTYDEQSLNSHLYWTMSAKGFLGIACEPNCIFQICNQVPILGFRFHDLVYGGDTAGEVTAGYLRAWNEWGLTDAKGHFRILAQEKEHAVIERQPLPWGDFWLGALMHAWNADFVEAHYPEHRRTWVKPGPDGTLWVAPSVPPTGYGRELTSAQDFGWAAVCASELGDHATLQGLLGYADRFLNPIVEDGAYYYGRRDGWLNENGQLGAMDPHTGNALLAYARLNVPNGLRKVYERPWHAGHFTEPALIDMPEWLDVLAARYVEARAALSVIVRGSDKTAGSATLTFSNVWERGAWRLYRDEACVAAGNSAGVLNTTLSHCLRAGDGLEFTCPLGGNMTSLRMEWRR